MRRARSAGHPPRALNGGTAPEPALGIFLPFATTAVAQRVVDFRRLDEGGRDVAGRRRRTRGELARAMGCVCRAGQDCRYGNKKLIAVKMQIAVPRWFLLLVGAGLVLAVALAVFLPLGLYMAVVVGWFAAALILFARWSHASIGPRIEAALARGERRPSVEVQFPRWVGKLAQTWLVLFGVSTLVGVILLIVAAIEMRFG
jgi:hypothetical protein